MAILTGAQASYFWQGLATAMPNPTNTAPDAVVISYQTDTFLWFLWDGASWLPLEGAPNIRLTSDYQLEYSLDGGTSWTVVTGWDTYFPAGVQHYAPRLQVDPAYSYPPIPLYLTTGPSAGADYVYNPSYD